MGDLEIFDYTKVKVKKEKKSPSPTRNADEILEQIIPTLFSTTTKNNIEPDDETDEKKNIMPAKSSNEILAELFKVFNSTPPKTLLNDDYLLEKKDKKKHKKNKKHKKKSKKKDVPGGNDDEKNSNCSDGKESKSSKHKKKKKKKSKKRSIDHLENFQITIKTEANTCGTTPPNKIPTDLSNNSDFTISDLDEAELSPLVKETKNIEIQKIVKIEKEIVTKSPIRETGKIIIKCLKDTNIFKEADEKQKEKETKRRHHHHHHKDKKRIKKESDSELSLSDEETYLKEREYRTSSSRNVKNESYRRSKEDSHDRKNRYSRHEQRGRSYRDSSRDRYRSSWRDGHDDRRSSSRSRRRSRSRGELGIDKKRLLEIARKNAINMFKKGSLPGTQTLSQEVKDKVLLKMRYGGKTVEDLTDFCKKLSNGENLNEISDLSSNEESDHDRDGNDKAFHHPFILKDRGPIVMNIKNAIPIPPKSAEQTKAILMQFPVSSGQQHRLNESEWVPVPQKKPEVAPSKPAPLIVMAPPKPQGPKNVFSKPLPAEKQLPAFSPLPILECDITKIPTPETPATVVPEPPPENPISAIIIPPLPAPPAPPILPDFENAEVESIFPQNNSNIDVSSIITKRLNAMRRLQENPMDSEAIKIMYTAQKDMSAWANSKHIPGQFTGSTGVNVLSARELNTGMQAWAKKDQLKTTTPVSGGMGMHLLQKMGWRPGEGLGRERNGALQPLLLDVKLDKRGLVADEEDPTKRKLATKKKRTTNLPNAFAKAQEDFELKHPVSLLGELATKRRWILPAYELVDDKGPAHSRNFIFKVIVNGIVYQPSISANTKKQAKATAAKYCLQQMGVLPV